MAVNVTVIGGKPTITYKVASTNAVQTLAAAKLVTAGDHPKNCNSVSITVETANIRYAFGVDPTQAGLGHLVGDEGIVKLNSYKAARDFRFISAAAGVHGAFQITIGF